MVKPVDSQAFNVALGKLLIAAAWVDGEVSNLELNCLKTLILQMPQISFEDWRKLKIYLAYPITAPEQKSIVEEFTAKVYSNNQRKNAWQAILAIIEADGQVTIEEKSFTIELETALHESTSSFLRKIKFFLFKSSILSEKAWQHKSGREKFIHEFFDNPIYFIFRKAILKDKIEVPQTKPELQRICLFAGILCWIAKIENNITLDEKDQILEILMDRCGLNEQLATCILKVASTVEVNEMHLSELVGSLADSTNKKERNEFFTDISKMVMSDKKITVPELECMRTVALYLDLEEEAWFNIMSKINIQTKFFE